MYTCLLETGEYEVSVPSQLHTTVVTFCDTLAGIEVRFSGTGQDGTDGTDKQTDRHTDRQTFLVKYYFRFSNRTIETYLNIKVILKQNKGPSCNNKEVRITIMSI